MNESLEQVFAILRAVWRRRLLVLLVAWAVAAVGWAWVYKLENQYRASARVYVDTQSLLQPLLSGLAVQPNLAQQVSMMTRTLVSRPNIEKVARMTDLDLRAKTPQQQEELYNDLTKRISLSGTDRENLYTIGFEHSNPDLARRVVQALLTIFTESSLGTARRDLSQSQKFIDDQLKAYEAKLHEKERELEEFKRRNVGTMPGQGGAFYTRLSETDMSIEQTRMQIDELDNRKRQLRQQLEDQEETLSGPAPVTVNTSAIDARISSLQTQLDNLRLRYTDRHPEMQRVTQLIERLQEQKRQEEDAARARPQETLKAQNPIYQQLSIAIAESDANLASLRARLAQLQARRAELFQSIDRIPQLEAEFTQMMRDYDVYKANYAEFLKRRETAAISGDVESKTDVVDFRVIDPPRVPKEPVWPNRPLLVTAVPLGGVGAGFALAFLLTQLRPTVESRRQLRDLTDYPLLGMVTRIDTDRERRRARRLNLLFVGAALALLGGYLVQLIYYLVLSPAA